MAFLLKDDRTDEKAKELLKKVVFGQSVKLIKEKQASTVKLASKPNLATTSVTAKQLTKLHTTKPVMVAQSAKPILPVTIGVVQSVSKPHVAISSSVAAVPAIKSVESRSSPPKTTGITLAGNSTTSLTATQSSVVKTGSGLPGLVTRVTVPSPPKAEKKKDKKKKLTKDSPSLPAALANTGAVKNSMLKTAASSNPSHMLTSTTGLPGILQYITSGGSAPLVKVITKAAGGSQPAQPTTAAPTTIITTSDGRLLLTGASQPQVSITQASFNSGKSIPSQSPKGAKSGGVDGGGISGLLKKGGSADTTSSKSVVGGALSSSPRQQHASVLKTTPVIQIPRVQSIPVRVSASASSGSTPPASNSNTAVSVAKSALPPPPPPLATITSTKGSALDGEASIQHPQAGKAIMAPGQPLKQFKLGTLDLSTTGQPEQDLKHIKAALVVNNNQQTVLKTVTTTTVPLVQPAQTVVPLTGTTIAQVISQLAPDSFSIPSLPKLVASSKQVGRPVVQQLPLALPDTTNSPSITKDMPPLTHRVVPETPPLSTAPLKESSPLKSPVEQIMEEHSYLGSSHSSSPPVQPAGQNPWQQLQFVRTSSPEQQLQLQSGENVFQACVPKDPSAYAKDQ